MIELTKLNGSRLVINSDLIEFVEALPDSLITLTTGKKIMVQEKIPEIVSAIISFRRMINQPLEDLNVHPPHSSVSTGLQDSCSDEHGRKDSIL